MRKPLRISKKDLLFIKWRRCLLFYNNNKENNQPLKCECIYDLYMTEVKKELDKLNKKKK
tara:strand:- start:53 stop:232 length:180 start_codon:yes stop_codon:yes gene_type:complete